MKQFLLPRQMFRPQYRSYHQIYERVSSHISILESALTAEDGRGRDKEQAYKIHGYRSIEDRGV